MNADQLTQAQLTAKERDNAAQTLRHVDALKECPGWTDYLEPQLLSVCNTIAANVLNKPTTEEYTAEQRERERLLRLELDNVRQWPDLHLEAARKVLDETQELANAGEQAGETTGAETDTRAAATKVEVK